MKDKEKQNKVFDILDKMELFQGQRAGRELWNDKPKEVQDKDISDFIKDINYIRSYLQDSVVFSREEYIDLSRNYVGEQVAQSSKETAEKILKYIEENFEWLQIDEVYDIHEFIANQFGVEIKE